MKILLLLLLSLSAWAQQGPLELKEDDLNPTAEEVLIKKPEKHLQHESMIYNLNTTLGINDQRQFTGADRNRLSMAGHVSGDYEHFNELLGGEATFMTRTERYDRIWWGAQVFRHRAYFDNITQNPSSGGTNSDAANARPGDVKDTIFGYGPGMSYRFKFFLDFFETEDVFESVDIFVNMIELNETHIKEKYRGWGLTTNYGIHKRTSTSFFWGGKFSYNVANVTRPAIGDESKNERSLSLGWLSMALELGFFF